MESKKLAVFLLLVVFFELLLLPPNEASPWWRRRRRRRSTPSCSSSKPAGIAWVNNWQGYFSRKCHNGYFLAYWRSQHRNCKEDRIYYFQCAYSPIRYQEGNCAPTNYENDYDGPLTFKCAHNGFITGVKSVYSVHHKDRRYAFRCCNVPGYHSHTCKHTGYLNGWDQEVNYRVPPGYYLVGVNSYHHNHYEDRRWSFEICKITKSGGK